MNLTTQEQQAFNKVPASLQPFLTARMDKPYKNLSQIEQAQFCRLIIGRAFFEINATFQNAKQQEESIDFQTKALQDELKGKYGEMTRKEIQSAFNKGIRNEFGNYFGLCSKTYHQFLKSYYESKERAESMRVFLQITDEARIVNQQPTPEQKEKIMVESSINAFNNYKENQEMPFVCSAIYDFLCFEKGLIKWTNEQKTEIVNKVKGVYVSELKQHRINGTIGLIEYQNIVNNLGEGKNRTLVSKVKNYSLRLYFDNLINSGTDLKTLLNN